MTLSNDIRLRIAEKLRHLYGGRAEETLRRIDGLVEGYPKLGSTEQTPLWNERDVVLITYGDQIRELSQTPLATLHSFLQQHRLHESINALHLLPFFPYSSDDGFSVIDYRQVDPQLGDWDDIATLRKSFGLMFDLVLNHCSREHASFQKFLAGDPRCRQYFHEIDPGIDLSAVTRPRTTPLLTPFETGRGAVHVWSTFSHDQVDLNFGSPDVLIDMLDVLLFYVQQGARIIRLDAIAYLWKTIGTSCIHLPETHLIVKLMRDLLDGVAPGTILLTETNVPHDENVSYFGDGDEAHIVYQFSLAPLLLDAFLNSDAVPLQRWLAELEPPRQGTTYFNFTASHDGIGVRPLEGLVSQERLDRLVEAVRDRGGAVSTKRNTDGTDSPYELNITYSSALGETSKGPTELHIRRFLSSQAIMLALQGIPGIYFHSLVGSPNWTAGVEQTERARTINRRKFEQTELEHILSVPHSAQRQVFDGYRTLLETRIRQPAFHPDAAQEFVDVGQPEVIGFLRRAPDETQRILVLANVSSRTVDVDLSRISGVACGGWELISNQPIAEMKLPLAPCQTVWIRAADSA